MFYFPQETVLVERHGACFYLKAYKLRNKSEANVNGSLSLHIVLLERPFFPTQNYSARLSILVSKSGRKSQALFTGLLEVVFASQWNHSRSFILFLLNKY